MNNKNNNYRVMKFLEPVNKKDKAKGYVRLDIRGIKGNIIVTAENIGDPKSTSEVYLYKDRVHKLKLGDINNRKGTIKKIITFNDNNAIEDYNICGVVKDGKIVLYANLFNAVSKTEIAKLEDFFEEKVEEKIVERVVEKASETNEKVESQKVEIPKELKQEVESKEVPVEEAAKEEASKEEKEDIEEIADTNDVTEETEIASEEGETISEELSDDEVETSSRKSMYKNKFEEDLYNTLKDYKKVDALSVKIKDLEWWYIPHDDKGIKNGCLPYYNQVISSYYPYPMTTRVTTCSGLMKKYGHYIFGIFKDKGNIKRFVYGVPGEFRRDEQPYKGITGFKNWSYKNKKHNGDYGYWLAFVDAKTGEVTESPQIVLE